MSIALVIALTYFVALSAGVSFLVRKQVKSGSDFVTGGGKLPWQLIAAGFVLAPLGAGHTLSLWQRSAELGASVLWWGIMSGGVFVPLFLLWFGPWFRRLNVQTFPEGMGKLFGEKIGYAISCVFPGQLLGICIGEITATATAIYALSGASIKFTHCIIIAMVLTIIYVFVGGLMQVAWMNLCNAVVMIGGSFIAVFYTGRWLNRAHPELDWEGGGWESIAMYYEQNAQVGEVLKTTLLTFTPEVIFLLMIPCVILTVFMCSASQVQNQPMLMAKSESDIRRGTFFCSFVNSMATYPWVILALVGMAVFAIMGIHGDTPRIGLLSVPYFAIMAFPPWLVGLLMTALLAATLSTTAALILASSHIVVNDIFKRAVNPRMSDRTFLILIRCMIVVCALVVLYPAVTREIRLMSLLYWVFSFAIPVFGVYLIGMLWKISRVAAWTTLLAGYAASFLWTFLFQWNWPEWIPDYFNQNVYPTIIATLFFGIVMNLILPGEPGFLKQWKEAQKNNTPI